jgi:hypothetical protein
MARFTAEVCGGGCRTDRVVAGLAIDAFLHLDMASSYDGVNSSVLTQGDMFRAEAALAIIAALALVVRPAAGRP